MPAALQCPDCGHQEMLDNLGGLTTFRCGGCGRALKVPAQFRNDRQGGAAPGSPGARPPSPSDRTQAMPVVPAGPPPGAPLSGPQPGAPLSGPPTSRSPIAVAGASAAGAGGVPPGGLPPGSDLPPLVPPAPLSPESLRPPLILRLALWVIALPLGTLLVFAVATWLKVLTKSQLEDTFLLAGWGRFLPIARLLPLCALVTALLVQLGVLLLERRRARNLRGRRRPPGPGRPRPGGPGPRRPLAPTGQPERATNGARSRDRVIS